MTTLKRSLTIGLIVIMVACFLTACSSSSDSVIGEYTFQKATRIEIVQEDGKSVEKAIDVTAKQSGLKLELKLEKGGKATLTVNSETVTGTWSQEGDTITVSGGENTYEFIHKGTELLLIRDNVSITLSK